MLSKSSLAVAIGALSLVGVANAETRQIVTYVGGHNGLTVVQTRPTSDRTAPYALTGQRTTEARRFETIWVGQRFAGLRPAN